ncbi:MAG: hypothetical protein HN368_16580 [Spirochaetales bacterium]|nr:hypothetical protein [Spirochaetales bacterium]
MEYLKNAVWIPPTGDNPLTTWVKNQISIISSALCGETPKFQAAGSPGEFFIIFGCSLNNPLMAEEANTGSVNISGLNPEEFALSWGEIDGKPALYIEGVDPAGAVYGVFHFFKSLGCSFDISGDRYPATNEDMPVTRIRTRGTTANTWRGIYFQYCFATNSLMSLRDYELMFDQMAKMRLNRICYYYFPNEPFLDFSFRGERKLVGDISYPDSGYMSYGRHFSGSYLVSDIEIGGELFNRDRVAPMEFQDVRSSDEALDTGKKFLSQLIDLAAARGIKTWISFLPTFVPPNFAKYLRRMPRPHLHWSALVSATDPVLDEINRCRLEAILANFPKLDGVFCGIPEGYYEDPYPESQKLVEERRAEFTNSLKIHRDLWGGYWNNDESVLEDHIRRDICFTEIADRTLKIARELSKEIKLGVMTVCKSYLAGYLDEKLPKDVVFADIESRSLWTKSGAPLHLFKDIKDRECVIIPRAYDDGSMAGLQFNIGLYDKDRYVHSALENGTDGLLIQLTHLRGNEHNTRYLAAGMWDPSITPQSFYDSYAETILPGASEQLSEFCRVLDEADIYLGGRGLSNMP